MTRSRITAAIPYFLLAGAFAATLGFEHARYLAKGFAFHDLGLINDFLASLFRQGRVFRVFDLDVNHLSWHFTPSLFLLTPFYGLLDSQALLLDWSTAAAFGAYAIFLRLLWKTGYRGLDWLLAGSALAVIASTGLYGWRLHTSGHFEHLYVLGAALTLYGLMQEWKLGWVLASFLLAAGTREDAGLFLACQCAALFFLPVELVRDPRRLRRRALGLAAAGLACTVLIVKVIFPLGFGISQNWHAQRLWFHLGGSFEEIAVNLLTHPWILVQEIQASAFRGLNGSFLWLPWLRPTLGFVINAPGALFYTTATIERKQLFYYNSAMLLPGFFLATVVGLHQLRSFRDRCRTAVAPSPLARIAPWSDRAHTVLLAMILAQAAFGSGFERQLAAEPPPSPSRADQRDAIAALFSACPTARRAASDFKTVTFLPNHVAKFLLSNYAEAEVVVFDPLDVPAPFVAPLTSREGTRASGTTTLVEAATRVAADPRFIRQLPVAGLDVYLRRDFACQK